MCTNEMKNLWVVFLMLLWPAFIVLWVEYHPDYNAFALFCIIGVNCHSYHDLRKRVEK